MTRPAPQPAPRITSSLRCLRGVRHCLCLGGALHALLATGPLLEPGGIAAALGFALAFVLLRIAAPILLLLALMISTFCAVDAFVTLRWQRFVRR